MQPRSPLFPMKKLLSLLPVLMLITACNQTPDTEQESVVIQGSDTEVQLVSTLVEAFAKDHPDASISVAGGGSAVGIAALLNGETDIANSSRMMKQEEWGQAAAKKLDVQEFILARDGLSVIVHPENILQRLSVDQIGKIFRGEIANWKDVGGSDAPIVLYGRQSTSGTFGFFRDTVVKGEYASTMRQMEGSQALVDSVVADKNGIGYVGVGYVKDASGEAKAEIKIISVSLTPDGTVYSPLDKEAVESEAYPIARQIFQYLPSVPKKGSVLEQFMRFEASEEGQKIVEESGFYGTIGKDEEKNASFFEKIR